MTKIYTGGCQCGAVRFRVSGELGKGSICHCRMCQKAFGNFYAPLVSIREGGDLTWTRGQPKRFQSSNMVARGFCAQCGTPLTYETPEGDAIAIGAFDNPAEIVPVIQFGVEGKLPYTDHMADLPTRTTEEDFETAAFLASIVSNQHPDHDTKTWPQASETDNG
ncbi:GFA family protein [Roseibium salinum]|uniref:GFA family protein n=1 Tax=Roseibium salinum TaxID=1604349 RepID=A0ABT3R262_9HYPH|nr:GFA family protein [Roseibium sp. DSM 29163]MCX2723211.1 GFA family protein [Roseibium sp. DSM 29163]MDN3718874.1 GFA family protein [Roseibium salinum]